MNLIKAKDSFGDPIEIVHERNDRAIIKFTNGSDSTSMIFEKEDLSKFVQTLVSEFPFVIHGC